jgi:hypothetical protein
MTTARGWTNPRIVRTVDAAGARVDVIIGVTTNAEGQPVAALGIGDSDTALFDDHQRDQIALHMGLALADAEAARRVWRRRHQ